MRSPDELDRRELEALLRDDAPRARGGRQRAHLPRGRPVAHRRRRGRAARAPWRASASCSTTRAAFGAPVIIGLVRGKAPGRRRPRGGARPVRGRACRSAPITPPSWAPACSSRPSTATRRALLNTRRRDAGRGHARSAGRTSAVLLDAFHMNIEEVSIGDAIRAAGERLGYFHVVDSNRRAAGFGHVDYAGGDRGAVRDRVRRAGSRRRSCRCPPTGPPPSRRGRSRSDERVTSEATSGAARQ